MAVDDRHKTKTSDDDDATTTRNLPSHRQRHARCGEPRREDAKAALEGPVWHQRPRDVAAMEPIDTAKPLTAERAAEAPAVDVRFPQSISIRGRPLQACRRPG